MFFLVTVLLLLTPNVFSDDLKLQYYKQLINKNVEEIKNYKAPDKNIEIQPGANASLSGNYGEFDFIIVGAGSAGCTLAGRLSELEDFRILLLEAGGEESDFTDIPAMHLELMKSKLNWGYKTTPQKNACFAEKDQRCDIPRGKVIGGTSTINGLHFTRCNRLDYDNWALAGNTMWAFSEVLPYFKKSENSQINGDRFYHGKGGPLNIEYSTPDLERYPLFVKANAELGIKSLDYNGREQLGFSKWQHNTKNGKRMSTGRAFLANARRRSNLNVTTEAFVTQVIIDEKTKKAVGVYFVKNGKKYKVSARKEVILSAGAYNTPQLLMLSGIGPKEHLEELGVTVIKDLPVGKNLMEHPGLTLYYQTNYTAKKLSLEEKIKLYINSTGPLTKTTNIDGVGFQNIKGLPNTVPGFEYLFGEEDDFIFFTINLQHPKSVGSVTLKSKSPIDFPVIDLNLLSDPDDVEKFDEAVRFVFKMSKTKAFASINATLGKHPEACKKYLNNPSNFIKCYKQQNTKTMDHPYGTAKMGVNPANSVVDQFLRVHGIGQLRVIDASVIPTSMSGHLNGVVIMIAERASDFIKRAYIVS